MKIAFVLYDRPNYTGGPLINALRLLPELVNRGHEVLAIIGYVNEAPSAALFENFGVKVKLFKQSFTENNVYDILKITKAFSPDVFVSNISAQAAYAGYWIKKSGIPTIIAHRSDDARNWCTAKTFGIKKWKWQHSAMICVSEFLKNESLKQKENDIIISVIPSGVPIPNKKVAVKEKTFRIVYTGRLVDKQKKIWDTINAFIEISKQTRNIIFTIIGEGKEKEKLINYVNKNNLSEKIVFKNKLLGDAYHQELQKHHAIVLLSDYEGMPGSIMDGMACGLVPICFDMTGIDELVKNGKTGLIVKNRKDDFYKAVELLNENNNLLTELSYNARLLIKENYSITIAANRWELLFEELLRNSSSKKSISKPLFLNLPTIPDCYKRIKEDIRKENFKVLKSKTNRIIKKIIG